MGRSCPDMKRSSAENTECPAQQEKRATTAELFRQKYTEISCMPNANANAKLLS